MLDDLNCNKMSFQDATCYLYYKLYMKYFVFSLTNRTRMLTEKCMQQSTTKVSRGQTEWHHTEYWSPKLIISKKTSGQPFLHLTGEDVFGKQTFNQVDMPIITNKSLMTKTTVSFHTWFQQYKLHNKLLPISATQSTPFLCKLHLQTNVQ